MRIAPRLRAGLLAIAGLLAVTSLSGARAEDQTVNMPAEDVEMNAAIEKARASIGEFWKAYDNPALGEMDFALKVRISIENASEHFWLTNIERTKDGYAGIINSDPASLTTIKVGQRHEFKDADISDWMFGRNGRIVGNETMRPLLKRMPAEQAEYYRRLLEKP